MTDDKWAELMFDAAFGGPTREHSLAKLRSLVMLLRSQPMQLHPATQHNGKSEP